MTKCATVSVDVSRFICVMKPSAFHLLRTIPLISVVIHTGNTQLCISRKQSLVRNWGEGGEKKRKKEHLAAIPNADGYGAKADGVSDWLLSPTLCDRYKVIAELPLISDDTVGQKLVGFIWNERDPCSQLTGHHRLWIKRRAEIVGRWDTSSGRSAFESYLAVAAAAAADGRRSLRPIISYSRISAEPPGNKSRFMTVKYKRPNDMWHQVWWTQACDPTTMHVRLSAFRVSDRADRWKVHSRVFVHFSCRRCFGKWLRQNSGICCCTLLRANVSYWHVILFKLIGFILPFWTCSEVETLIFKETCFSPPLAKWKEVTSII